MFERIQDDDEKISFEVNDHYKIILKLEDPPFANQLVLEKDDVDIFNVSVSYDKSKQIQRCMKNNETTYESFISLLTQLKLTNFVNEISRNMSPVNLGI